MVAVPPIWPQIHRQHGDRGRKWFSGGRRTVVAEEGKRNGGKRLAGQTRSLEVAVECWQWVVSAHHGGVTCLLGVAGLLTEVLLEDQGRSGDGGNACSLNTGDIVTFESRTNVVFGFFDVFSVVAKGIIDGGASHQFGVDVVKRCCDFSLRFLVHVEVLCGDSDVYGVHAGQWSQVEAGCFQDGLFVQLTRTIPVVDVGQVVVGWIVAGDVII